VIGSQIRTLLGQILGVEEAEVRQGSEGEIEEILIRSSGEFPASRIRRNIESALISGLGLEIDHRVIRIEDREGHWQENWLDGGNAWQPVPTARSLHHGEGNGDSKPDPRPGRWIQLIGVRCEPDDELHCEVTVALMVEGQKVEATVREADILAARVVAAGRATVEAVDQVLGGDVALCLEGIEEIEINDATGLLAAVRTRKGNERRSLQGSAIVEDSAEEAASRAVLDALNRFWPADEPPAAA
jgi:hypothetical protein